MTQLQTEWLCVATSGATADGRQINAADLEQMAATYDPKLYTALIWEEHNRLNDNLGQVVALKAQKAGDKVKLFAILRPNARLIGLNQQKQKLFTSIEIIPNFAKTGTAYLGGLAVTDSPASLGTTRLQFSTNGITQTKFMMGNKEPLQFSVSKLDDEVCQILVEFNRLNFAEKRHLFEKLATQYRFSASAKPSQVAFMGARKAISYQSKFNLAV